MGRKIYGLELDEWVEFEWAGIRREWIRGHTSNMASANGFENGIVRDSACISRMKLIFTISFESHIISSYTSTSLIYIQSPDLSKLRWWIVWIMVYRSLHKQSVDFHISMYVNDSHVHLHMNPFLLNQMGQNLLYSFIKWSPRCCPELLPWLGAVRRGRYRCIRDKTLSQPTLEPLTHG